jgi:hypothetical protein
MTCVDIVGFLKGSIFQAFEIDSAVLGSCLTIVRKIGEYLGKHRFLPNTKRVNKINDT